MKCSENIKCTVTRGLLFSLFVLQFVLPAAIEILKVPYAISIEVILY